MRNSQTDSYTASEEYTLSFNQLCAELGCFKSVLLKWLQDCNITDWVKGKFGTRWFKPETLEILRQAKKPPEGWIRMSELEERLQITRDRMALQVSRLDKSKKKQYWRDMYLSPEAVIQLTVFFSQPQYAKRTYKPRTNYYRINEKQREKESLQWAEEPVDESELVTFEGYVLTPEEHALRLEIRNKRGRYIPAIVIENFRRWNVH